jgi:hypothetical protein
MTPKVTSTTAPVVQVTLGAAVRIRGWIAAIAAAALLVAAVPSTASAAAPSRVTIVAVFDPLTYGENAFVNGQLLGDGQGDQLVTLEQAAPPFADWTPVAQITSDAAGYYSFKLRPSQTMQYRTSSQGTPSDRPVQVSVAPRIKLSAEPAGKSAVRYSGRLAPALDGQTVAIQRRDSSGAWTTVTNAALHGGTTFGGRLRARHPVTLRAFFPGDGAHLDGFSNDVKVAPGRKRTSTRAAAAACRTPRITRISTSPAPPVAGKKLSLRVRAAMTGGKVYAIDVRWGVDGQRDHFVFAPQYRKAKVTFDLTHTYKTARTYTTTIRVYGRQPGCERSWTSVSRLLRVTA